MRLSCAVCVAQVEPQVPLTPCLHHVSSLWPIFVVPGFPPYDTWLVDWYVLLRPISCLVFSPRPCAFRSRLADSVSSSRCSEIERALSSVHYTSSSRWWRRRWWWWSGEGAAWPEERGARRRGGLSRTSFDRRASRAREDLDRHRTTMHGSEDMITARHMF